MIQTTTVKSMMYPYMYVSINREHNDTLHAKLTANCNSLEQALLDMCGLTVGVRSALSALM